MLQIKGVEIQQTQLSPAVRRQNETGFGHTN